MTTHATPDWKVTTGYRVLMHIGWGATTLALMFGVTALLFRSSAAWWIVAGLAVGVLLLVAMLPEPLPREMLTARRTMVGRPDDAAEIFSPAP